MKKKLLALLLTAAMVMPAANAGIKDGLNAFSFDYRNKTAKAIKTTGYIVGAAAIAGVGGHLAIQAAKSEDKATVIKSLLGSWATLWNSDSRQCIADNSEENMGLVVETGIVVIGGTLLTITVLVDVIIHMVKGSKPAAKVEKTTAEKEDEALDVLSGKEALKDLGYSEEDLKDKDKKAKYDEKKKEIKEKKVKKFKADKKKFDDKLEDEKKKINDDKSLKDDEKTKKIEALTEEYNKDMVILYMDSGMIEDKKEYKDAEKELKALNEKKGKLDATKDKDEIVKLDAEIKKFEDYQAEAAKLIEYKEDKDGKKTKGIKFVEKEDLDKKLADMKLIDPTVDKDAAKKVAAAEKAITDFDKEKKDLEEKVATDKEAILLILPKLDDVKFVKVEEKKEAKKSSK